MEGTSSILIASLSPYFLEKESFWFEKNLKKILEARRTQIFWQENTLFLEKGLKIPLSFLLRKLDEMGYEKVWQVFEIGEFSQRGGIVDVFPINLNFAIRIEFLGNKIENIFKLPVEIKDEKEAKEILKKKLRSQKIFSDLKNLKPGDYLVHLDHGIGIYKGQTTYHQQRYYLLEYDQGDKLYVPFGLERKLSRYVGFSEPKISRLGTLTWIKTKRKVKEEAEKFARELLKIYAKREIVSRPPYLKSEMVKYLKESFPFEETPDQEKAIEDLEKDLEKEKPMDRLICGDVGFGKTEVALRAMVKVVESGYQAVMLCPTTILANQHYQNFKKRLENLPVEIGILTRVQSKKEQKETIRKIKEGKIDILIGTHRILSKDVEFKKLGLLVIDDEHKFGVRQKEKLKNLRAELDVLSLSATPIPRTLYLSLSGLREISLIQIPPAGRLPIKTFVLPFSEKIIKKAIEKELERGGQVYYLHNRVETIETAKRFLENLFIHPGAFRDSDGTQRVKRDYVFGIPRFGIAHGRLKEKELVKVMEDFQNKKIDVLVATTIIEAGLDLPNVNTLIVADSTKLGLSQAYQIRGRIGRSHLQAFAYFLYPQKLTPLAKERLKALKEAEELGSGYKIALKDLELRGAGNILGKEQSGNINKVGLNLYCQMLSEAIEKIKKDVA
jgi:transcription-repair coupling factor (superfamily II helicase)